MAKNHHRHFLKHKELYEAAVRQYVCSHCIDFGDDGMCHTKDPAACAIFRSLPELVNVALALHKPKVEPYTRAVREHICSQCENSKPLKTCSVREALDCGLDRYLPLVLEAIEAVDRKLRKEA